MTLLQLIIIVTWFVFLLFSVDLYERKKFNFLHFLVFFGGTGMVVLFVLKPTLLDTFWRFFWIARGADLLVYMSIILLGYLYFELIHKFTRRDEERTILVRSSALDKAKGTAFKNEDIVFVVPSYGEDETVIHTIQKIIKNWYKVIVVDDWKNKIHLFDTLYHDIQIWNVLLITHPINLWQWAALQTGADYVMNYCKNITYIVHFDADGQHRIEDLQKYIEAFKNNPSLDIVLWSRFLWWDQQMSFWRTLHKKLQLLFMKIIAGIKLTDTNNGYRMIKVSALPKLRITLNRMTHASEIESLIVKNKLAYTEVPVIILYTEYSLEKWQSLWIKNVFGMVKELLYKWWLFK